MYPNGFDVLQAPITGRISEFIPFLPFSPGEQAVVVHKFLMELGQNVRAPVDLSTGPRERLLGNIRLHIRKDAAVCRSLAETGYSADLGARSLITAVKQVEDMLVGAYLEDEVEILEGNEVQDYFVDAKRGEIIVKLARST